MFHLRSSFLLGCILLLSAAGQTVASDSRFEEHGVAAPVSRAVAFYATEDQKGDPLVAVWLRDLQETGILLIDPRTGASEQFPLPVRMNDAPYATFLDQERFLYALSGNRFWEFDLHERKWTFSEEVGDQEAMSFTRGSDGTLYAATYPKAHIVSFHPGTRQVVDHGPINRETWPQYPRSLAMGRDGWLYSSIGNTLGQTIAFHPRSGQRVALVPEDERVRGRGRVFLATDGTVYGTLVQRGDWHRFSAGEATRLSERPAVEEKPFRSGTQQDTFPDFPRGGSISAHSIADKWLEFRPRNGRGVRVSFSYNSAGAHVYSLYRATNGKIYGSTGHPLRFFEFSPSEKTLRNSGLGDLNGHLNAFAEQTGGLFGALYSFGDLVRYDLQQEWTDQTGPTPTVLTRAAAVVNRPSALVAHADERHIVMTGTPSYGATGGGMLIYDTTTNTPRLLDHEQLVPYQSTHALLALPDGTLVGGTTVAAGTGGVVRAQEAVLYLFDLDTQKITFQVAPAAGAKAVLDLVLAPTGLVYGLTDTSVLFAFDPDQKEVLHEERLSYGAVTGGQAPKVMALGPDGRIFVLFRDRIAEIDTTHPTQLHHSLLAESPVPITVGAVVENGRLYFASGASLWSVDLEAARNEP